MSRIGVLAPSVQGQIAAGEVVERPASVVRELVENAIDAGASRVEVALREGGVSAMTVWDDGGGLSPDEAVLAFARHATSKLRAAEDLETVATFGFRGEALPSIAAAGRVTLRTRRREDGAGASVEADLDGVRRGAPVGMAPGTVVEVRELFGATPARRKFLRRPATELGHVVDVVTRLAVARPGIGFRVVHDERAVLDLPRVPDLGQRLVQVLGRARAEALAPVQGTMGGFEVEGFLGSPRDSLSSARLVWTYVTLVDRDGGGSPRWIRDRMLLRAVLDGYEGLLMRGRYPIAVLVLRCPPGTLDVNVHPAKLEVRFRDGRPVHRLLSETVRTTLRASLTTAERGEPARPVVSGWSMGRESGPAEGALVRENPAPAAAEQAPDTTLPTARVGLQQPGLWRAAPDGFSQLRFVAQVFDGYLLCDAGDRLVLVDQHAAHERVLYERLCSAWTAARVERQALLVPEAVQVTAAELAALVEQQADLDTLGLEGEAFGDDTYLVRSIPTVLRGRDVGEILRAVAAELVEGGAGRAAEEAVRVVLATVACHSATRVGQRLGAAEARALLESMDRVAVNAHCPHGRPVAVQLSRGRVEALFGR